MKLDPVIPYLKNIQKIYKSSDTPFASIWHQHFFTWNNQFLLYREMQINILLLLLLIQIIFFLIFLSFIESLTVICLGGGEGVGVGVKLTPPPPVVVFWKMYLL